MIARTRIGWLVISEMRGRYWLVAMLLALLLTLLVGGIALAQGPTISNVAAGNITATSAVITWTTDEPADSRVLYGNTTLLTSAALDSALVVNHAIALPNLTPSTLYYYEVRSTNAGGNTTIDDNGGSLYTFTTLEHIKIEGWGWCSNYGGIVDAVFEGDVTMVERSNASQSFSLHVAGNLTLSRSGAPVETIALDMYGSRVRSLFYLRQEVTGKSVSLTGVWIDAGNGTYYISTTGVLALPNPGGQSLKTARICFVMMRTPAVDVPLAAPGSFVEDVESMLTRFAKLIDKLWDGLIGTGFREVLSDILSKVAVLLAYLRAMGTPYTS